MNDSTRLPDDDLLVERFFERQRREILQRVAQREDERRFRRSVIALAASAALVTLLLGGGLLRGPAPAPSGLAWIESASLMEPLPEGGALELFGAWDDPEPAARAAGLESPLPPLTLELDDALLDDIDFDPFLPNGSEADDALAS